MVIVVVTQIKDISIFVPLLATDTNNYSLLNFNHITDFFNLIILLSPLGIMLVVYQLFFKNELNDEPVYRALSFLVIVLLISVFLIDPEIGMPP